MSNLSMWRARCTTLKTDLLSKSTALVFITIWASSSLQAQESNVPTDIVVTATRSKLPASALPLTIDVIDAQTLSQQVAISGSAVDAVAALTPSFSPTRQKLSGAGETLRGRSPLYAINGIPQSTPLRDGSRDGFTIDPFFIDRIELIYGSNALQGIGATGGIVNQVTVGSPKTDGISGRILAQLNSDAVITAQGLGYKLAALSAYKGGSLDVTAGATFERRGVFSDGNGRLLGVDGVQGEIQDSKSWSAFGRVGVQIGDSLKVEVLANRYELKGDGDYLILNGNRLTGLPTSAVLGKQSGIAPVNTVETVSVTAMNSNLWGGNFVSQLFFNRTRDTFGGGIFPDFQDPLIPPFGQLFDQSENRSRKYGGKISYERALPGYENLTAIAGFDALFDRTTQVLIATNRPWVPQTDFRSYAPFAQLNLKLLDGKLRFAGGVRSENVEIKIPDYSTLAFYGRRAVTGGAPRFSDALLNGGVIIEPVKGIRFYASYAEGFTVPDVGRITRAITQPNISISRFLDISPIVSNNREIGLEIKRGPLDASATYFTSSSRKGQLLVLINDVFEVQRQRVEIKGLEINAAVQLPLPGLKLSAGFAHLNGRADNNGDDILDADLDGANISPDRLNLAADYVRGPVSLRLQHQFYVARAFAGSDPRNAFDGYEVLDAFVRFQSQFGAFSIAATNLLNRQYITYNSDTVRPTDNTRFFAGRGRSITLGWDVRF